MNAPAVHPTMSTIGGIYIPTRRSDEILSSVLSMIQSYNYCCVPEFGPPGHHSCHVSNVDRPCAAHMGVAVNERECEFLNCPDTKLRRFESDSHFKKYA